jgi:hypothetical protein
MATCFPMSVESGSWVETEWARRVRAVSNRQAAAWLLHAATEAADAVSRERLRSRAARLVWPGRADEPARSGPSRRDRR